MENRSETPSLLKAESIMLGVRHEKEGKLRVTYAGWDDAKVVRATMVLRNKCGLEPRLCTPTLLPLRSGMLRMPSREQFEATDMLPADDRDWLAGINRDEEC